MACMWFPDFPLEPVWVAVFEPTGGCLGNCDGCHAWGSHMERPSSARSVTPLYTLLSLSDPVSELQSDRFRKRETIQETELRCRQSSNLAI